MFLFLICCTGILYLAALHWLFDEIRNAPEGWEDERGFHYGRQPTRVYLRGV